MYPGTFVIFLTMFSFDNQYNNILFWRDSVDLQTSWPESFPELWVELSSFSPNCLLVEMEIHNLLLFVHNYRLTGDFAAW